MLDHKPPCDALTHMLMLTHCYRSFRGEWGKGGGDIPSERHNMESTRAPCVELYSVKTY